MKYVYMLWAVEKHYKVGVAINMTKRLANIQTANPNVVEVVTAKLVDNAEEVEGNIHTLLHSMKANGGKEWFELTPNQAVDLAVHINKNPEVDVSEQISLNTVMKHQRWQQKLIDKKLDTIINSYQKNKTVAHPVTQITDKSIPLKPTIEEQKRQDMEAALEIIKTENKASTSLLQRRLHIGYGRAARIIDELEEAGYISKPNGAKPRTVL